MYISTLTLTIIAVDRYVVIIHPFRSRMRAKTCAVLVVLIDATAAAATFPYMFNVDIMQTGDDELCQEMWPSQVK